MDCVFVMLPPIYLTSEQYFPLDRTDNFVARNSI